MNDIVNAISTGIIPAYAGSTYCNASTICTRRDHPRVCGEHPLPRLYMQRWVGSSPRMRGAHPVDLAHVRQVGIIPAYAGSTFALALRVPACRDHPRVCGEHMACRKAVVNCRGSSPRMRGAPFVAAPVRGGEGIIPAYAGSTRR